MVLMIFRGWLANWLANDIIRSAFFIIVRATFNEEIHTNPPSFIQIRNPHLSSHQNSQQINIVFCFDDVHFQHHFITFSCSNDIFSPLGSRLHRSHDCFSIHGESMGKIQLKQTSFIFRKKNKFHILPG